MGHSYFLKIMIVFQSSLIEYFNVYREYIFDNTSLIEGFTPFDYLTRREHEINFDISDKLKYITDYIALHIDMDEPIVELFDKELCSFNITDYFKSTEECKNKFGIILNYNFNVVMTNFLQKLRNAKNIVKYKFETENIIGNLPSYDVEKWNNWNDDYLEEEFNNKGDKKKISFKLDLFNNETIHSEMNLIFLNIFLPYLDESRKLIVERININNEKKQFIINYLIYVIILFLLYFTFLVPMLRYLNDFIYNTKNMLLLIPLPILVTQSNIKSSLDL